MSGIRWKVVFARFFWFLILPLILTVVAVPVAWFAVWRTTISGEAWPVLTLSISYIALMIFSLYRGWRSGRKPRLADVSSKPVAEGARDGAESNCQV